MREKNVRVLRLLLAFHGELAERGEGKEVFGELMGVRGYVYGAG